MTKEEKNKLAEENLGLVYAVVNKKFNYVNVTKEDKEIYIEEGMIGLVVAINTYNGLKGKFSSYAFTCIYHEICRYVKEQKAIKRKIDFGQKKSVDEYVPGDEEELTYKDTLVYEKDDYSSLVEIEHLLAIIRKTKIKDIEKIVLRRAEGYTYREIAKMTGICKDTVKSRLEKAREKLVELGVTA